MKNIIHVILLQTLLTFACIWEVAASPPPAFEGRGLYVSYCQLCHGVTGKGNGPLAKAMRINPADLTTTVRSRSDTILVKIITGEGRPTITGRNRHDMISNSMPEWKNIFNKSQIKSLIAYLRFMSRAKHNLMGDPKIGLQLYNQYCQVCHGVEGEGDGVMTKLIGIVPMDLTNPLETDRLDNKELIKSILDGNGRYMPAWRDILSQGDVESLVSYIRLLAH
ncbi:MAG: c-type cytochrome [bacterium]|nr:c-type cytochrome [bacterium]